jgi:hypothetical protein
VLAATDTTSALDYWTLAIAIIGAATGIAALLAQVWQFALAGPRIKVAVSNAMTTQDGRWWLDIDVRNPGRMPVTVLDVGLVVEIKGQESGRMPIAALHPAMWQGPPLSYRLVDGNSESWRMAPEVVALDLLQRKARHNVRAYVRLATGKTIDSRNRIDVVNLAEVASH